MKNEKLAAEGWGNMGNEAEMKAARVAPYESANVPAAGAVAVAAAVVAGLYTFCFKGIRIVPGISFTVFCPLAFVALAYTMKRLGCLRDRGAFWYALPIMAISIMNGLFTGTLYPFMNVLLMHGLFGAFALRALGLGRDGLFGLGGALRLLRVFVGDWAAAFGMLAKARLFKGRGGRFKVLGKYALGAFCALPFLLIIGALLVSADRVFAHIAESSFLRAFGWLEGLDFTLVITFLFALVYMVGYIWCAMKSRDWQLSAYEPIRLDVRGAAMFLGLINALFLAFAVVQFAFLFTGGVMKLPGDLTYAEYAREGFFQLLAVTVINFGVIFALLTAFKGAGESRALRGLMFALIGFTLALVASSGYRMFMYVSVYGFTTLRLSVITFLVMEIALSWIAARRIVNPQTPFARRFILTGLAFYIAANVTGSIPAANGLNAAMYNAGLLKQVEVQTMYPFSADWRDWVLFGDVWAEGPPMDWRP